MATEAPICQLKGVQKSFNRGDGKPLRVLEDITLDVRPNEVLALLGPSGCGKSTILRIVAGLIPPSGGEVLYHGEPLRGLNGIAIVLQSFALFPGSPSGRTWRRCCGRAGLGGRRDGAARHPHRRLDGSARPFRASCPAG